MTITGMTGAGECIELVASMCENIPLTHLSVYINMKDTGYTTSDNTVLMCHTIFNMIAIQGKSPDGKWTRKPLAYRESNIFNLCVICLPEVCVNLVFKYIHAASSYTICI